ncbi:hypothetical protein [Streptomyces sp. NBC_00354]|uniref:hypothetical protein n=1 Tax=Streptomyces sp. NBC_00354 TaxID=2975723 RepID=UPI002E27292B
MAEVAGVQGGGDDRLFRGCEHTVGVGVHEFRAAAQVLEHAAVGRSGRDCAYHSRRVGAVSPVRKAEQLLLLLL